MAAQTAIARTSPSELQLAMEHPSEAFIRQYAFEVFGNQDQTVGWLNSELPALGDSTPESLLHSAVDANLRRVLTILVQIDYGVIG